MTQYGLYFFCIHAQGVVAAIRPLSVPFLFRTSGKGTDMATPLGLEKYGRIDFSPGRWTPMGQNASKLVSTHAKDDVEVGRNFFTFTFKAVGVTFLKVIFHLPRNAPIWSFWISMEVVSYLSPPVFLTSLPHHCYIPQHCLSLHGGYWCKKT